MITWAQVTLELPGSARPASEAFWSAALDLPFAVLDAGPFDAVPFDPVPFDPVPFDPVPFDPVPFDPVPFDAVPFDAGQPARVHLDLVVEDLDAETDRIRALGATVSAREPHGVRFASPGGAVFGLVTGPAPQVRPAPVAGPDGGRRRLVQVCLDIPHGCGDAETAFWRAVLPWRWVEIAEPEFLGRLVPPAGAPLEVLLQELGADDPGTEVRAHLDLGSDDLETTTAQLVELGAVRVGTGDGFVALRDPVGMVFCVCRQSPDNP